MNTTTTHKKKKNRVREEQNRVGEEYKAKTIHEKTKQSRRGMNEVEADILQNNDSLQK